MYSRYGDSSWDSAETTDDAQSPRSGSSAARVRPRRDHSTFTDSRLPSIVLHGVRIHAISETTAIDHVLESLEQGRGGVVVTPNLDHLRRCTKDVHFAALVAESELVVCDGMPLVWASRLQGTPVPERVAGSNLIYTLTAAAALRGRSVFMLGGAPSTAEGAAEILKKRCPGLRVVGTYCPPKGFERNTRVMGELSNRLTASGADIVYVALGSPKQELLIAHLRKVLPKAWWLGVGNSFSFICGHVRRAPLWMQNWGLEWVHRLSQEPRRLFRRYLVVGVPFGMRLVLRATYTGVNNRLARPGNYGPLPALSPPADSAQSVHESSSLAEGQMSALASTDFGASDGAATEVWNSIPLSPGESRLEKSYRRSSLTPDRAAHWMSENAGSGSENARLVPAAPTATRLLRLRALVLLGGSVRPSALSTAAERSVLDLPLDEAGSLLNFWLSQAAEVANGARLERLPVRVMVNHASPEPCSAQERHFGSFRVERDRTEYRGTGGVLHDLAADYEDDDLILVANAAQVLLDPLIVLATALERRGGDVSLVSHDDGTPSGAMLVTCKSLRPIPDAGYVDMKEQALPRIASQFEVRVLRRRRPSGLPVRTLEDYVQALRFHHRRRAGKSAVTDPLAEDWSPAFSIVEPGATVGDGARVHDSIVLAGGIVDPGAVVVRCVVCPGGVVRRDRTAVDQFVTGLGTRGPLKYEPPPDRSAAGILESLQSATSVQAAAFTSAALSGSSAATATSVVIGS